MRHDWLTSVGTTPAPEAHENARVGCPSCEEHPGRGNQLRTPGVRAWLGTALSPAQDTEPREHQAASALACSRSRGSQGGAKRFRSAEDPNRGALARARDSSPRIAELCVLY